MSIKVAPPLQHSPILGHLASWQTVASLIHPTCLVIFACSANLQPVRGLHTVPCEAFTRT